MTLLVERSLWLPEGRIHAGDEVRPFGHTELGEPPDAMRAYVVGPDGARWSDRDDGVFYLYADEFFWADER